MYSEIVEILDSSFGNMWFLDSGTLLGVIREGKFLPQDKGIDISVLVDSYSNPEIEKHVKRFRRLGFVISRRSWGNKIFKYCLTPKFNSSFPYAIDLHLFVKKGDSYYCPQFINNKKDWWLKGIVLSIKRGNIPSYGKSPKGMIRYAVSVCVSFVYRDLFEYFDQPVDMKRNAEKGTHRPYIWKIPSNLMNGTEIGKYMGLRILTNPDEYLKYRYGDWKTPVSDWVTLRDDGGVRASTIEEIDGLLNI